MKLNSIQEKVVQDARIGGRGAGGNSGNARLKYFFREVFPKQINLCPTFDLVKNEFP